LPIDCNLMLILINHCNSKPIRQVNRLMIKLEKLIFLNRKFI